MIVLKLIYLDLKCNYLHILCFISIFGSLSPYYYAYQLTIGIHNEYDIIYFNFPILFYPSPPYCILHSTCYICISEVL